MKCRYCGNTVDNQLNTCPFCGKSLIVNSNLSEIIKPETITPTIQPVQAAEPVEEKTKEDLKEERRVAKQAKKEARRNLRIQRQEARQLEKAKKASNKPAKQEVVKIQKTKHYTIKKLTFIKVLFYGVILALLVLCFVLIPYAGEAKVLKVLEQIKASTFLKVMNIIMFYIPYLLLLLLSKVGWFCLLGLAILGIIISLLMMIKTSKTQKFILLGIIALYVAYLIIVVIIYRQNIF